MRKYIVSALVFLLVAGPAWADGFKTRKQLKQENEQLKQRVEALEAEIEEYRRKAAELEEKAEEIADESEISVPAAQEEFTLDRTDSLLNQWYLHRHTKTYKREEYDMETVHFTSNVPDSVLMRRLEEMNSIITLPFNETVKNYMILYSEKMPKRMGEMLGLSQYYWPIFDEIFRRYNLPLELKYITIIESRLNPFAESRAGAMGVWQFMYRTAIGFGMRIDSYVDERMDPIASAEAAARYFRDAYRVFGDWALVLSSYNCGSGNLKKAIKRAGGKTDFWSVYEYLPTETRNYVPGLVGVLYAFHYAKEYGLRPTDVHMPVYVDTIHIHKNLHLSQISEVLGIPLDDVRQLNPQYYTDIVPGAGGDEVIRLPFNYSSAFLEKQDIIFNHRADVLFAEKVDDGRETENGRPVPTPPSGNAWITYTVKSGDTLGGIAGKYRCTVKQLKSWNNLRGDLINIGQKLKIRRR